MQKQYDSFDGRGVKGQDISVSGCSESLCLLLLPIASTGWRGTNNKTAFNNTRAADLVRQVLVINGNTVQSAEAEIKEFLRTTGDRAKAGQKRKSKSPAHETAKIKPTQTLHSDSETDNECV